MALEVISWCWWNIGLKERYKNEIFNIPMSMTAYVGCRESKVISENTSWAECLYHGNPLRFLPRSVGLYNSDNPKGLVLPVTSFCFANNLPIHHSVNITVAC